LLILFFVTLRPEISLKHKMKKLILSALIAGASLASVAQNEMVAFTKQSAVTDTVFVNESEIYQLTKTATGSNLEYFNGRGDLVSLAVRERSVDVANVASSVSIIFSGAAGDIDSLKINGVNVLPNGVAFRSTISLTASDAADTIQANTEAPVNFAASDADSTLTISAPAGFGDTANAYVVIVYSSGGITEVSANPTTMTGGFTAVRNVITLTNRMINIEGGAKAISADRVKSIVNGSGGSSAIFYEGARRSTITTTDNPATVVAAINAL
jgi:hypothetical protein